MSPLCNPWLFALALGDIELVVEPIYRLAGANPAPGGANAYFLSFIGRRMRDPYMVDCQGMPDFVVIVDRLLQARHLGTMASISNEELINGLIDRPVTVTHKHGGRWREEEKRAVERCGGRGA